MRVPAALHDVRFWALVLALVCAAVAATHPRFMHERLRLNVVFVVDVTGSMNVRDYDRDGQPESRLEHVKRVLARWIASMPCGSKAGLAIFTERRPFLLLAPADTCADYPPLSRTLAALDWRMAWEGDSRVASGLYGSLEMTRGLGADLVFLSDGQEAPPLPYSGGPTFDGTPGAVKGLIVGVGGHALSPIPKFDDRGQPAGFYAEQDVSQESRVGLPPPGAENRPGYNPRNAPFGGEAAHGTEHLSSVREEYLRSLAQKTGLGYAHLDDATDLATELRSHATPAYAAAATDLAPWLAGLSLAALAFAHVAEPLSHLFRNRRSFLSRLQNRRTPP